MRCVNTHDSGPYVLGALSSVERETYERHMSDCAICREEVADLAVLPSLLGRLDLASAEALMSAPEPVQGGLAQEWGQTMAERGPGGAPVGRGRMAPVGEPPGRRGNQPGQQPHQPSPVQLPVLLSSVRERRDAQRRRSRWQAIGGALAAASVAAFAAFGVSALTESNGTGTPQEPNVIAMQPVAQPAAVTGWISAEEFSGGTRIYMRCKYGPPGDAGSRWTLRLFVVPKTGQPEEIGSWGANFGEEVTVNETTWIPKDNIDRIELRRAEAGPLLTYDLS